MNKPTKAGDSNHIGLPVMMNF